MDYFAALPLMCGFLLAAEATGVPQQAVLEAARVDPGLLGPEALKLRWPEARGIIREAVRLSGDSQLGLHAALLTPWHSFGVAGHFVLNHATIEEQNLAVYNVLEPAWYNVVRNELWQEPGTTRDIVRALAPRTPEVEHFIDYVLFFPMHMKRVQVDPMWVPRVVSLERQAPADPGGHEALFGCPVRFGQAENYAEFDSGIQKVRPHRSDPLLLPIIRPHVEQYIWAIGRDKGATLWLQRTAEAMFGTGEPLTLRSVADQMRLRPRTLQQKLFAEGVGFKQVVDGARREAAVRHLAGTQITVDALAAHLGFSDSATLVRAFQRWTGRTPAQWRRHPAGTQDAAD